MKNFGKTLYNSIFKFDSYKEFFKEKFSKTIKYYIVLILIVSVFISIPYVTRLLNVEMLQSMKEIQVSEEQQQALQGIIDVLQNGGTEQVVINIVALLVSVFIIFIFCSVIIMCNILLMSMIGLITAKITGTPLVYKEVFNISVYSFSFSIILIAIYLILGITTGLTISYFNYIYTIMAYIYLVTALILIKKGDNLKKQPIGKIKYGKKTKKEEPKIKENKEKKKKEKKEKKEEKNTPEPQGNET